VNKGKAREIPHFRAKRHQRAMLCDSDNGQRFVTVSPSIFPLSFLTSLHYYPNHQLNSPLHLSRRKSIVRISPSPLKNSVSALCEPEVSTVASSFSDLRTNKASTKLEPLALIWSMGKQRVTKSISGSKREAALRSYHPRRDTNGTKGKRRSARLIFIGPVTRSHSKVSFPIM
jgi:hypothetical protein